MSKARITRLFIGGVIAGIVGGFLVAIAAAAFPRDVFVMNGSNIVAVHGSEFAWTMLGIGVAGALILVGAAIAAFAAWVGALLNMAALERKRWFVATALLGILNCGLLPVLVYIVAGPDGQRQPAIGANLASAVNAS